MAYIRLSKYASKRLLHIFVILQTFYSVPQGSTLRPLLYLTYASELQEVTDRHGVAFHGFADDTQLSKSVCKEDVHAAKQTVIDSVLDIQQWSNSHRLKLNAAKSEVIWLGKRQQLAKLSQSLVTASSSRRRWSETLMCTLISIYPCKSMLITVPRCVSFTCNRSVSCAVTLTTTLCIR